MPDRFVVERQLGAGAFGVVYQSFDRKLNARVALKTLSRNDPKRLYYLKHEFRSLAGIVHPNLVTYYELLTIGDQWLIVMELIEGRNFLEHVSRSSATGSATTLLTASLDSAPSPENVERARTESPAISPATDYGLLRDALGQLACGLAAVHDAGKLHRDIKPSNVLVTHSGRVVLLDFGLVEEVEWAAGAHEVSGTLQYMAPEQAAGKPCPASDWYAVGVMLHQCLTGRFPRYGPGLDFPSHLPADMTDLCRSLLHPDPAKRAGREAVLAGPAAPPRGSFVGRASELAALSAAFRSTAGGRAVTVRLSGSSGIGKSALLAEFQKEVRLFDPAAMVIGARCFDRESVRYKAFDGVVDGISRRLSVLSPAQAGSYLPRDIAALARLFPVLGQLDIVNAARRRAEEYGDPQELRRRAFEALREMLARIASENPTVVIIDDLQWSDLDSVPLFETVLREPDSPAILLIAAYRADEAGNAVLRELLPRLEAGDSRELRLGVLPEEDARRLAQTLAGGRRAEAVVRESAGNPFLIDALMRFQPETAEGPAPTLEDVIGRQVDALPEPGRVLLELLAIAARPVNPQILCGGSDPKLHSLLVAERLVRSREREEIEPYHDRIRETVVARLAPDRARAHHLTLARAFAAQPDAEPETVALHFHAAGDFSSAAPYAESAADRATQALAFNRAIALYRMVLDSPTLPGDQARSLRRRLGDALSNADRAGEAAEAYRAAAETAPTSERIDLLRIAGERLLVSGRFDEGFETMRSVLKTVNMDLPSTPRAALFSVLWRRTFLRLRGFRYRSRPAEAIPERELQTMDACASLATGLAAIDPIRAMDFQAHLMMKALRAGEPSRVARALAIEAGIGAVGGERTWKLTEMAIRAAEDAAAAAGDPGARYLLATTSGMAALFRGRWEDSVAILEAATRMQPPPGSDTSWISSSRRLCLLFSWIYSGDLATVVARLPGMIADSRGRGDLHAETSMRCRCAYMPLLAADRPDRVPAEVQGAMTRWSQRGYHFQHFWALLSLVDSDVYRGDAESAWTRIETDWAPLRGSMLPRVQLIAIEAWHLRARAALALAASRGGDRALLARANADIRRIERERVPWGLAVAQLLRAAATHIEGRPAAASMLQAEVALSACGMRLHAAAARRVRGRIEGDEKLVRESGEFMAAQQIRDPDRMTGVFVPVFRQGGRNF